MTRQQFAQSLAYLQAGIGREFSDIQQEVWYATLQHLDAADFGYAVQRYVAEGKSAFPMPAQLLEYAAQRQHGETLDHGAAFANVMKAVRECGSYQPDKGMATLDAATQAAVRACGGFLWFCEMEADTRSTMAAQFRMAYQQAQEKHERDRRLPEHLRPAIAHERRLDQTDTADEPLALGNVLSMLPGAGSPSPLASNANGSHTDQNQHRTARRTRHRDERPKLRQEPANDIREDPEAGRCRCVAPSDAKPAIFAGNRTRSAIPDSDGHGMAGQHAQGRAGKLSPSPRRRFHQGHRRTESKQRCTGAAEHVRNAQKPLARLGSRK